MMKISAAMALLAASANAGAVDFSLPAPVLEATIPVAVPLVDGRKLLEHFEPQALVTKTTTDDCSTCQGYAFYGQGTYGSGSYDTMYYTYGGCVPQAPNAVSGGPYGAIGSTVYPGGGSAIAVSGACVIADAYFPGIYDPCFHTQMDMNTNLYNTFIDRLSNICWDASAESHEIIGAPVETTLMEKLEQQTEFQTVPSGKPPGPNYSGWDESMNPGFTAIAHIIEKLERYEFISNVVGTFFAPSDKAVAIRLMIMKDMRRTPDMATVHDMIENFDEADIEYFNAMIDSHMVVGHAITPEELNFGKFDNYLGNQITIKPDYTADEAGYFKITSGSAAGERYVGSTLNYMLFPGDYTINHIMSQNGNVYGVIGFMEPAPTNCASYQQKRCKWLSNYCQWDKATKTCGDNACGHAVFGRKCNRKAGCDWKPKKKMCVTV